MKNRKWSKGAVRSTQLNHSDLTGFYDSQIEFDGRIQVVVYGDTTKEARANRDLTADAFKTAQKSNLYQSELLEQRDRLLSACKEAFLHHQGGHSEIGHLLRTEIENAEKIKV